MEQPQSQEVLISNKEAFDAKIAKIKEDGSDKLHVLTDFDRTLTYGSMDGKRTPSIISRLREDNYLGEDYVHQAHKLYDHYHVIEVDEQIPLRDRIREMDAWWEQHFKLLAEKGLDLQVLSQVVDEHPRMFRDGVLEWIDELHEKSIPTVIMSASLGDMIRLYLEKHQRNYDSIHIVSNLLEFNEKGKVIGVKRPIVHSLNKSEVVLKDLAIHDELSNRTNVILLGDGLGDLGMIDGFDHDELLTIGFYNDADSKRLGLFQDAYDVVVTGDGDFSSVRSIFDSLS